MPLIILACVIFTIFYGISIFYHNSNSPSAILYRKQYIGHARHQGPYKENTLQLYHYLINTLQYKIVEGDVVFTYDGHPILNHGVTVDVYKQGIRYSININKITLKDLKTYSILPHLNTSFTTVEEFIRLGKQSNVCVMLDLTFQKYTLTHLKTLYNIVVKYKMQNNTIWGDANVFKLALLNRGLICQVGGSWGKKLLIEAAFKSLFCRQLIMSFSYYGGQVNGFEKIVRYGHQLGFIMKVATINERNIAEQFWKIGTDLINTDCLIDKKQIK
ncbi:MAG: hypothetical protein J6K41_05890 [Paraprevotella sp.]|nr:hypothetical protein [Paraprevotella sp.]